ncbi:MAG: hypothetical protein AAFQ82_07905 [Myxococcota bacterium]
MTHSRQTTWAELMLRSCYPRGTFIAPMHAPYVSISDAWSHCVMPFDADAQSQDGELRQAILRSIDKFIERLKTQKPDIEVRATRTGPAHVEFVINGHFRDRKFIRARLRRAVSCAYRSVTGSKLHWREDWAALLTTEEQRTRCSTRFCIPELGIAPGPDECYDSFVNEVMMA